MPYTHYRELTPNASGNKLDACTATESSKPASFYSEDISVLTHQLNYVTSVKMMATFWGARHPVLVGVDAQSQVMQGDDSVIVLKCPPYYPPSSFPGMEETEASKPANFVDKPD